MSDPIEELRKDDAYEALPDSVKQYHTHREWSFLTDAEKADLIRSETEPMFP